MAALHAQAAQERLVVVLLMHPDGAGLAELVRLVDAGELAVTVDSRYPL
ncbi:hypothetical protein AB0E57_09175, partial [Micrococcus luteus]